jgi:hypothetical protein
VDRCRQAKALLGQVDFLPQGDQIARGDVPLAGFLPQADGKTQFPLVFAQL